MERLKSRWGTVVALTAMIAFASIVALEEWPMAWLASAVLLIGFFFVGAVARNPLILPVVFIPAALAALLGSEPATVGDMEVAGSEMIAGTVFYLPLTLTGVILGWCSWKATGRGREMRKDAT